jgi:ADP-heptose:LPS heptosyltransferase
MEVRNIIISRTDGIGDVVLTLPMAGLLKKMIRGCRITFLGRSYTKAVLESCSHVDDFIDWDELANQDREMQVTFLKGFGADAIIHVLPRKPIAQLAKLAGIPVRIGTTGRWYHWPTCNRMVRFSRRRSSYHEAQLNTILLRPLGLERVPGCNELYDYYGLTPTVKPGHLPVHLPDHSRFNLILHPFSKGSAREWGIENYCRLIRLLPESGFRIFITGTTAETQKVRSLMDTHPHITDLTGRLSLAELITFIQYADGLIACSTGPLHLAAALGKAAIGIYPPIRPMHPGRWAPLGPNASFLVLDKTCSRCRNNIHCACIKEITPQQVYDQLIKHIHQ